MKRIPRTQFKARLDALEARLKEKPEMSIQQMEKRLNAYCDQHGIEHGDSAALQEHVEQNPDAPQFVHEYLDAVRWLMDHMDGLE